MSARFGDVPVRCCAVAAAVIAARETDPRVLLLRRAGPLATGAWGLVTGGIDPGETATQAARREIREETGFEIGRLFTTGLTETFYLAHDNTLNLMPIFVGFVPAPAAVTLDHGSDDSRWCTRDEAINLMHFAGQRRALADIWHDFIDRLPEAFREVP
jgi:dATP pyrophosphohydrolase